MKLSDLPDFINDVKENVDEIVNDSKVEHENKKKMRKNRFRSACENIAHNINDDIGRSLETMFEGKDKLNEKLKNLGYSMGNPLKVLKFANSVKVYDLDIGDHIFVKCFGVYTHHGIYIGDEKVIHYSKNNGSIYIGIVPFNTFNDKKITFDTHYYARKVYKLSKIGSPAKYSGNEVVERAKKRMYESSYNLLFNNCENFARWCRSGD